VHIVTDTGIVVGYCSFCRIVEITHWKFGDAQWPNQMRSVFKYKTPWILGIRKN
jgi:hypothetical protein